ncbi:MAG: protein kinase [Proteobacteria bacterium]|nr:protein kinase [Pseudomonadota bacterium]
MSGPHGAGDVIQERYKIIDNVGEGGMQFVYAARDRVLKRKVALKTPKNDSAKKRFARSAIVAARVNHPNVAKTLDYLEDNHRQYLIEELIEGEDLEKAFLKKTKCLDPYLAARVFHYLAKGLAASHHAGVIHRDLKPTNIMVTDGFQLASIKITDFGIAKMANEEIVDAVEGGSESISASSTVVGALPYMAPEAIDTPRKVGKPADIWSFGAMMFELLTGEKPYGSGLKAVAKIQEAKPPEFNPLLTSNPQFAPLANKLEQLVLQCLQKNPSSRLNADALVSQCGNLCYPVEPRLVGTVREILHKAYGFINVEGEDVFFHFACVYGDRPVVGDRVMLSKFKGGGAWRAHPVVKLY